MMKSSRNFLVVVALISLGGIQIIAQETAIVTPPVAKKVPKTTTINGDTLVDNYYWLREKSSPEVISYLEAENAYADAQMKPTEALQAKLYDEMLSRIKQTDVNVPYRLGDYFYYTRTETGKQYQIYCRRKGAMTAPEEIVLDLNVLGQGLKYIGLSAYAVSDDGQMLAYSIDSTGFREYKLYVKDLRTGAVSPDDFGHVDDVMWANDNRTFFYSKEDSAKRPYQVFRHTLGEPVSKDALVYEEKDELYRAGVQRTRSRGFILFHSDSSTTTEFSYIPADQPTAALKLIKPRQNDIEYYPDHHGDKFYIRVNDTGRNYRLVTAPVADPNAKNWTELIPLRPDVMLEDTDFFADFYVLSEREKGLTRLRVTDFKTGATHYLDFPEPVYFATVGQNRVYETSKLRFNYTSLITPNSIFDYDMKAKTRELLKQDEVLGGYDPKLYASERVYATAADGVKVPISLVYRKDLKRDGQRPMLLYGYGSYGISTDPTFRATRLSLLDRGVIFAIAHIRGGGEMGTPWHDQGKMMFKRNTFTDFITCAEHLIAEKYTAKDRLVIQGGSAGGLLMGAVTNMRPDLFHAVLSQVPFVDVMNTMLDASLPLTVGEYLEWGNPNEKAAFDYMKTYSPYDNIAAKDYPTILVKTSLNDSQVMYWEPAKYVAKMRSMKTDHNVLMLKTNMGAGHGGSSGRYDALHELAFDYAFVLTQVGIKK
jgi:oligopeptidase B